MAAQWRTAPAVLVGCNPIVLGRRHDRRDAVLPGPRLCHGPDLPCFPGLRRWLEGGWLRLLRARVGLSEDRLPMPRDCNPMLGEPGAGGDAGVAGDVSGERQVRCEINVGSGSRLPPSCITPRFGAVRHRLRDGAPV